jgi:hypothetical protein
MDAARGASDEEVIACLSYLYNERGLKPGIRNGPRSFAWFVTAGRGLALWATTIATRVEYFDAMPAPVALIEVTTQDCGPAVTNVSERFPVLAR